QALARHGRVPSIEIFAPLPRIEACRRQLDGLPDHLFGEPAAVAQLFGESDLLARCEAESFDVLHSPMGIDLTTAGYLRSRGSGPIFPATCSQHGISYSFLLNSMFIPLLTAPIYPCELPRLER